MKKLSAMQREHARREEWLARPLPPDWTEWDTRWALMRADELDKQARWLLSRKNPDLEHVEGCLQAAADARAIAEKGRERTHG